MLVEGLDGTETEAVSPGTPLGELIPILLLILKCSENDNSL